MHETQIYSKEKGSAILIEERQGRGKRHQEGSEVRKAGGRQRICRGTSSSRLEIADAVVLVVAVVVGGLVDLGGIVAFVDSRLDIAVAVIIGGGSTGDGFGVGINIGIDVRVGIAQRWGKDYRVGVDLGRVGFPSRSSTQALDPELAVLDDQRSSAG